MPILHWPISEELLKLHCWFGISQSSQVWFTGRHPFPYKSNMLIVWIFMIRGTYTAKTVVLNLTPAVLIEDHTRWFGPLLTPRVLTLTPHFLQCKFNFIISGQLQQISQAWTWRKCGKCENRRQKYLEKKPTRSYHMNIAKYSA